MAFLGRNWQVSLKVIWKCKGPKRQDVFKRKNEVRGLALLNWKTYYKATAIRTTGYWHNGRHIDQQTGIENPKINSSICGQLIFNKGTKIIQQSFQQTGYPYLKEWIWTLMSHHTQKINPKWIMALKKVRAKTIKNQRTTQE